MLAVRFVTVGWWSLAGRLRGARAPWVGVVVAVSGRPVSGWCGERFELGEGGEEQLYRVVEAAAKARYVQLGGSRRQPRLAEVIRWLVDVDVIPSGDEPRWGAARDSGTARRIRVSNQ